MARKNKSERPHRVARLTAVEALLLADEFHEGLTLDPTDVSMLADFLNHMVARAVIAEQTLNLLVAPSPSRTIH